MIQTLITGGFGFTGRVLVKRLISQGEIPLLILRAERIKDAQIYFGEKIRALTLDEFLDSETNDYKVKRVFHLATMYEYSPTIEQIPSLIDSNITFPILLAEKIKSKSNPPSWVNVSTFMQHYEGKSYFPTSLYAATKQACEDLFEYFQVSNQIKVKTLVFPNIYGEDDGRQKLVNLLISSIRENNMINLSSGNQVMDLLHVSDAVDGLLLAESLQAGRWSFGNLESFRIREIVELISRTSKSEAKVNYDSSKDREFDQITSWLQGDILPTFTRKINFEQWLSSKIFN
jgi:nucleoside-diphosphate-sugar epimerase